MPTIKRRAQAEEDLIDIWLYIADDDVRAADRVLDDIEETLLLVANQPGPGPAHAAPAGRTTPRNGITSPAQQRRGYRPR